MVNKQKIIKVVKRFGLILAIFLFILFSLIYHLLHFRMSDASWKNTFIQNDIDNYHIYRDTIDGKCLRTICVGNKNKPNLVLIHGAPSSSAFWRDFMVKPILLENFYLICIDRPGYGYSDYGKPILDIEKQASLVGKTIFKNQTNSESYILASSYGGSLAAALAGMYPHLVKGVVFQSSSLKAGAEKIYPISYPTSRVPLKYLIPTSFRVANLEKLNHYNELKKLEKWFPRILARVKFLHGKKDALIYPENADFAFEKMSSTQNKERIFFEESGHDLYWTHRDDIVRHLLDFTQFQNDSLNLSPKTDISNSIN